VRQAGYLLELESHMKCRCTAVVSASTVCCLALRTAVWSQGLSPL